MNKRRREKAVKKLLAESEYHLAVLAGKRPRKKPPRLTYREQKVAEAIPAEQEQKDDSN